MSEMLVCHREDCNPVFENVPPILVRCRGCGLAGPVGSSEQECIDGWNCEIDLRNDVLFRYPNLGVTGGVARKAG